MDPGRLNTLKKRKITDKSLPNAISSNPSFAEDSAMYTSLIDMERKLDWTITRKRAEIQDAFAKPPSTTRILRLFLSHTVSSQPWQQNSTEESGDGANPNFETGQNIAAWQFKVDGRLLEPPHQRSKNAPPPRKFSTLIKRMAIELQRDPTLYPDGNIVEWPNAGQNKPALDGFTVRRSGDQPTKVRVVIYLEQYPEQYKLHPELAALLNITHASRMEAIKALWDYIKLHNLQDKQDRRRIQADEKLQRLFQAETIPFYKLAEFVNRALAPPDPIVLNYEIDPSQAPPEKPQAFDVEIQIEDTSLRQKTTSFLQPSKESHEKLVQLDTEIAQLAQSLHNSELKRSFLSSFAEDPAKFIQTWLESQSRDLETILGNGPSDGMTVRQEELRRSEFFQMPWVEEGVSVWNGQRMAGVLQEQMRAQQQQGHRSGYM